MALGEPYFAHKFYPNLVSADYVQKRVEDFYKTFYGVLFKGKVSE